MFEVINQFLYPLLLSLMIIAPTINLCSTKINKKELLVFCSINYLLSYFVYNYFVSNLSTLIPLISMSIFIYISTKDILYSIIISMFSLIIIGLSDAFVGTIAMNVFNISYEKAKENPEVYFVCGIFIFLFTYIISMLLKFVINKINDINAELKKYKKIQSFLAFTILTLFAIFVIYLFMCKIMVRYWTQTLIILHFFLLVCLFIISLTLIYSLLKIAKNIVQQEYADKEYANLKQYTTIVENVSTDLRRFKHDYLNILTTLGDYIEEKDLNGLSEFYHSELLPKSNKIMIKDQHLDLLKYIKLTPLKSLISSKIISAQALGIETKIEISEDIPNLSIDTIDICRIIGILFDNAIEGTLLCKEKLIHFAVIKVDTNTIFVINNTCVESLPPIYKLYEENFSTKGEGHGLGLKTIRDIINNDYNNVLINTKIEYGLFKQELIIKENDN